MVRTAALVPILLLAGCGDMPRARSESEIREIAKTVARDDIAILQGRVADLQAELRSLKQENARQDQFIADALGFNADLSKQVNNNARIANENTLAEMTRRGDCGKDWWQSENGAWNYRNKKCTMKDLQSD